MRLSLLFVMLLTLLAAAFAISADSDSETVEVSILTEQNWDKFAPQGKEVDAIYGDIVLRNNFVTVVIARPVSTRNANMTVRSVGGCLIDFTSRRHESDQLSCFYAGGSGYVYTDWQVSVDEKSQPLDKNHGSSGKSGEVTVISKGSGGRPTVKTTYRLTQSSPTLEIITEYVNDSKKTITLVPTDRIRADGGKELMQKSPNGTTDQFWIDDQFWQQAYVLTAKDSRIQSNSNSSNSTLKYINKQNLDLRSIPPENSVTVTRSLAAGRTRMDATSAANDNSYRECVIQVTDHTGNAVADAVIEALQNNILQGVLRTDSSGKAVSAFPVGSSQLNFSRHGHAIEGVGRDIEVATGDDPHHIDIKIDQYRPGKLNVIVKDGEGSLLPSKIEIVGVNNAKTPDFGPESGEFAVKNLRYTPNGSIEQPLEPGEYLLRVSRGPEYSAVEITTTIKPGKTTQHAVTLHRVIDTNGWVSTDFHSHSTPSGDNTSSQLGRVLNLVCQHIEFAPCTEHNRINSYQPHFDSLDVNAWISSVSGMELTGSPLPLNHQNVFPLHHHPHRQDGGGPVTDTDVETQIRRVSAWDNGSDKLVQQDHPDIGWLFYDKNGDGKHDAGHADGVAFIDVMEIHPIQRVLQTATLDDMTKEAAKTNRIFKWLQLLNQGYRIPGVVNTDAHYNFHGSGWIRNWVQCSTDDPAKIDHMEMVHASEEGRVVMSNGPFLQMSAKNVSGKKVTVGQDLHAPSKQVAVDVSVQCPNWLSVDTVFILLNGKAREDLIFTTKSHPNLFIEQGAGNLKTQSFKKLFDLKLEQDTHIVAVTGNTKTTLGPVMGPQWGKAPPAALTNPIYVDTDGDGFTPNKETLGRPLPVKGD